MESLGFRDFDFANWYGLMGPAGLPGAVQDEVQADALKVMDLPDVTANMSAAGVEKLLGNSAEFAAVIRRDLARHAELARRANIKVD